MRGRIDRFKVWRRREARVILLAVEVFFLIGAVVDGVVQVPYRRG